MDLSDTALQFIDRNHFLHDLHVQNGAINSNQRIHLEGVLRSIPTPVLAEMTQEYGRSSRGKGRQLLCAAFGHLCERSEFSVVRALSSSLNVDFDQDRRWIGSVLCSKTNYSPEIVQQAIAWVSGDSADSFLSLHDRWPTQDENGAVYHAICAALALNAAERLVEFAEFLGRDELVRPLSSWMITRRTNDPRMNQLFPFLLEQAAGSPWGDEFAQIVGSRILEEVSFINTKRTRDQRLAPISIQFADVAEAIRAHQHGTYWESASAFFHMTADSIVGASTSKAFRKSAVAAFIGEVLEDGPKSRASDN